MTISINVKGRTSSRRASTPKFSIVSMFAIWKERRELAGMDESRLRDLGISTKDAAAESTRPFWDLPKCPR